ncbi:LysR family transcriptional regulator [Mollicutes bacterium LVI A0039]|nr:LysR family transcriptional regulator [Mollicutes bacterium LVI A0039]
MFTQISNKSIYAIINNIRKRGTMESKDLKFFLEVANTGSFSQAAKNLYTVQSNVTIHIKKIENEFDVKLFNRNQNSVTLTPDGEKLLFYAENIIHLLNKAHNVLRNSNTNFCIGTTASISLLLPPFIKKCRKMDPTTIVSVKVFTNEELQNKRETSNLDCIITNSSFDSPFTEQLFQITEKLVLIYPQTERSFEEQLKDTIIVSSNPSCSYRKMLLEYLNNDNINILEFDSLSGIISSVELGIGVSLIPYKLVQSNNLINKISISEIQNNILTISKKSDTKNPIFDLLVNFLDNIY